MGTHYTGLKSHLVFILKQGGTLKGFLQGRNWFRLSPDVEHTWRRARTQQLE